MRLPRIMIAAVKSGSGKTMITCGLLKALKNEKKRVSAFKCGPDYIDPMFHKRVLGVPSENLDTFLSSKEDILKNVTASACDSDIAVIEGVMGLYDGLGVSEEGSSYHLAKLTKTPIILVVDVHGMGRSMAALIRGFLDYDTEKLIHGVILNKISEGYFARMKSFIETEMGIPVVGYFPKRQDIHIESRHLGLYMPDEIADIQAQTELAAEQIQKSCGLEEIIRIAEGAEEIEPTDSSRAEKAIEKVRPVLAVARDEAFCFYYEANLRLLRELGAEIKYFSPIHDSELPKDADGLLLGGGYPELFAGKLSGNVSMLKSIREAIENKLPSLAECGGFMYLHDIMEVDGKKFKMVGAVKGEVFNKGRLVNFGYACIREKNPVFLPKDKEIRAHEFHYFDSTNNGADCVAGKPTTERRWECVHEAKEHFWGFAHLYYPSAPELAEHFIEEMVAYNLSHMSH